jgi:dienelactone hydrolase
VKAGPGIDVFGPHSGENRHADKDRPFDDGPQARAFRLRLAEAVEDEKVGARLDHAFEQWRRLGQGAGVETATMGFPA